ncbi:SRPBCC domain-containing protein [Arthrobacter sp. I2-34]|uniref:SRPBCC domain-containing protein n=1 Tax=Arthrobacter hankyongi TaxID=2904801 RepID=A0ABS9L0Y8_9MICC|nr:SRPBCC domain-containing protein [Arthrobacter hankyongi]MCG2620293.1 SRPBCC domain-containing protein [Arthrobacter hankyongi]
MTTLTPDADKVIPTGRIERVDGDYVLAFDLQLDYPRSFIWSLLTEREKVAKWLGILLDDWAVGHAYELDMDGGSASGTVLQFNPPLSLQITWEDELGDESLIEWRVLESAGGTLLQFRARTESTDFLTEGSAGWQTILEGLEAVAAGRNPDNSTDRWTPLRDAYSREYSLSPSMGSLRQESGHPAVHFDRLLDADRDTVWSALTEPEQFARWLAPGELQLQAGGAMRLDFPNYSLDGDVSYVLNGQALEYSWSSPEVQESSVHWMLSSAGSKTLLQLNHVVRSPAKLDLLLAKWHDRLDALAVLLARGEVHPSAHRLDALTRFYRRAVGTGAPEDQRS